MGLRPFTLRLAVGFPKLVEVLMTVLASLNSSLQTPSV